MEQLENLQVGYLHTKVLIFRTNISTQEWAIKICKQLIKIEGVFDASVDTEDWENILRLETHPGLSANQIENTIFNLGYECSELD